MHLIFHSTHTLSVQNIRNIRALQRVSGHDKQFKKCNAAGFFRVQQFPVCIKKGPPPKGHPANLTQLWDALESTWATCLSILCRVHALTT